VIEHDGRPLATIIHDVSLAEEADLVRAVGGAASLALENERLDAELRANLHELRASRARIVESADAARRRIERDLHDGAQQQLVAILLALRVARSRLDGDPAAVADMLDAATGDLAGAIDELRELARGIHPAILSDRGLGPALEALAARMPVPVELAATPEQRLPATIEAAVYYVVSEALTNVTRYAQASEAHIAVTCDDGELVAVVADDGIGGADPARGSGLRGLTDRVAALDGRLEVESPQGRGTTVRAVIPAP
jgi:signal transduction histidine kinase